MAIISRLEPTLGADHCGLVLFDTLEGFLRPKDPKKQAFLAEHRILPNMKRLLRGAREAGLTTFYPVGTHAPDDSDTVARLTDTDMDLNPRKAKSKTIAPHIRKGSKDAEIATGLKPAKGDVVVPKHRWNAFYANDLEFHLKMRGIDTIIIAGGSTDVGIASTVYAARDLDLGIVVARDACYSMRGNNNDFLMERIFPRMGRVLDVDEVVALMLTDAGKAKTRHRR